MLYKYLKGYYPAVLILILVLGILFFLKSLIFYSDIIFQTSNNEMPFFALVNGILRGQKLWFIILSIFLFLIYAYYLVRLNLDYFFIQERTYLPALFYLMFSAIIFSFIGFHPIIISIIFLIIVIEKMLNSPNTIKLANYYDMGLLLAIGSLFYSNLLLLFLFVLIGLQFVNMLTLRHSIIILTGIITVYFIYWFYYFMTDNLSVFNQQLQFNFFNQPYSYNLNQYITIYGYIMLFVFVISLGFIASKFNQKKILSRKYMTIFILLIFYCSVCFFLIPGFSMPVLYIIAIPGSFVLTEFFISLKNKWLREILFLIVFISSVALLIIN